MKWSLRAEEWYKYCTTWCLRWIPVHHPFAYSAAEKGNKELATTHPARNHNTRHVFCKNMPLFFSSPLYTRPKWRVYTWCHCRLNFRTLFCSSTFVLCQKKNSRWRHHRGTSNVKYLVIWSYFTFKKAWKKASISYSEVSPNFKLNLQKYSKIGPLGSLLCATAAQKSIAVVLEMDRLKKLKRSF